MEMKEIEAFVLLAEYLHYGRTADLLHVTQPALTKQIKKLEEFLGSSLFERSRQGTKLTAYGRQVLSEAQPLVKQYDQFRTLGRKLAKGELGLLRIGFGLHSLELVPRLMVQFRQKAPEVDLTLKDLTTYEQLEALRAEKLDIGFLKLTATHEFETLPVAEEQLALITPGHSNFQPVTHIKECADIPFVMVSKRHSPVLHNQILQLCTMHGFHPRVIQEVAEVSSILALVKAGLGVTVLPPSFCHLHYHGVNLHLQLEPEALWSVFAAWRKKDSNPALAIFIKLLKAEVKQKNKN